MHSMLRKNTNPMASEDFCKACSDWLPLISLLCSSILISPPSSLHASTPCNCTCPGSSNILVAKFCMQYLKQSFMFSSLLLGQPPPLHPPLVLSLLCFWDSLLLWSSFRFWVLLTSAILSLYNTEALLAQASDLFSVGTVFFQVILSSPLSPQATLLHPAFYVFFKLHLGIYSCVSFTRWLVYRDTNLNRAPESSPSMTHFIHTYFSGEP